jgi:competence protein ComFC
MCVSTSSRYYGDPSTPIVVLHDFEGDVRRKIIAAKYHNQREHLRVFAYDIARYVQNRYGREDSFISHPVVTWAPTSRIRRRERGIDQSEILARHVGAFLRLPTKQLLRKVNETAQTGAPRAQRLTQVTFVARVPRGVSFVIVIDDVVTTGATMTAAVAALREVGVDEVLCIAIAGTP